MRIAAVLLALAAPVAFSANGVSEEFASGFGGVRWGVDFAALMARFPGGYEEFSTAPGRISYSLNIEDSVLGISRPGQHVVYGMGVHGTVDVIEIHVAYEQTSVLLSTMESRFGPAKSVSVEGVVTTYRWPPDHGMTVSVRTTKSAAYGLTALTLGRLSRVAVRRQSGDKSS